jgi:hypothetical protein
MNPVPPQPYSPLSLQDKLDQISRDRKVLDIRRELMRHGLQDGDLVEHRTDGSLGRLEVQRSGADPGPEVLLEDGSRVPFSAPDWRRKD